MDAQILGIYGNYLTTCDVCVCMCASYFISEMLVPLRITVSVLYLHLKEIIICLNDEMLMKTCATFICDRLNSTSHVSYISIKDSTRTESHQSTQ